MEELREAAYTGADGVRTEFSFKSLTVEHTKKTSVHNFPDADNSYVQDLGVTGRVFPMRMIIWGEGHRDAATGFVRSLASRGSPGVLEHPTEGDIQVTPHGKITRRDNPVERANSTSIEAVFVETNDLQYPSRQSDPASSVRVRAKEFKSSLERKLLPGRVEALLRVVLALVRAEVEEGGLASALDTLINRGVSPTLAQEMLATVRGRDEPSNKLRTVVLIATCVSSVSSGFSSRKIAVQRALALLSLCDSVLPHVGHREYPRVWGIVCDAISHAITESYSLKTEHEYYIDHDCTIIETCFKLTGGLDIDELISINGLGGDKILELKRGDRIVYYK